MVFCRNGVLRRYDAAPKIWRRTLLRLALGQRGGVEGGAPAVSARLGAACRLTVVRVNKNSLCAAPEKQARRIPQPGSRALEVRRRLEKAGTELGNSILVFRTNLWR
jgi:hypothetical protein